MIVVDVPWTYPTVGQRKIRVEVTDEAVDGRRLLTASMPVYACDQVRVDAGEAEIETFATSLAAYLVGFVEGGKRR